MDKEFIGKLIEQAGDSEGGILQTLYSAWEKKYDAYKADDSKANLTEWQAAEKVLKVKVEEYSGKYGEAIEKPIENLMGVVQFLKAQGYKIAKSKVYADAKSGLIKVNQDGTVNESEARAYAQRYLKKVKSGKKDDGKLDTLHREKAEAELESVRKKNQRLQFAFERDQGLWMKREDVETQFAIKMGAIDAQIKDMIRFRALDWINAVGGNSKKVDVLIELMNADVDQRFNELAEIEELKVMIRLPAMVMDEGDDWGEKKVTA